MLRSIRKMVGTSRSTPTLENADPKRWKDHLFGLTPERWGRLRDRSFWITGAGTGFGRSVTCALAAAGARVFLTGRREEKLRETLIEAQTMIGAGIEKCHIVPADIISSKDIPRACETVKSLCDGLHGLVNNAALPSRPASRYPLQEGPEEYWDRTMATNVKAPWQLTSTIFPHMLKSGEARVLFITSEAGWASTAGFGMYNVSKAALNSLCHSMAQEYAEHYPDADIQFNTVIPGEAKTEMNQGSYHSPYAVVSIVLLLLSHPAGGPNGRFFHRNGRHLGFCYTGPYGKSLI